MSSFLKTKINIKKIFIAIIMLLVLWAVLSFFPIIPKVYYLTHSYDFSYVDGGGKTKIDNVEWEENNLVVKGSYAWTTPDSGESFIHGFYKIKNNTVYLYVRENDFHFNFLKLVKDVNALAYYDRDVNFKFIIKNLPKKDYEVVLNNFKK